MDKTTLKFKADEQRLTGGQALFASDTINYIEAEFELGENWSGYDSVRAVWHTNHDSISTVLNEFGHCVVPQEVLRREGKVEVNLVGSIASGDVLTDRLTTYPIVAIVVDAKAKLYSSETSPITPSQFEQFASVVHDDATSAASSASDAATSASEAAASATRASNSDADAIRRANQAYNYANAAERAKTAAESARDSAQSYRDGALNAVQAASQAAGTAQTASSNANIYASRASESATNASQSASQAESAKNTILNMTVSAESLPEGSSPTVVYEDGHMGFGIPKGDTGATGAKGDKGDKGDTGDKGDKGDTGDKGDKGDKGDTGEVSLLELIANTKVDEVTDSVPYQTRTLSGVGSHESLRKIVGGTVAWNQLVRYRAYTANGVTSAILTDGESVRISGTSTATSNIYPSCQFCEQTVSNHVYLGLMTSADPNPPTFYWKAIRIASVDVHMQFVGGVASAVQKSTESTFTYFFTALAPNASIDVTVKAQIFDLTQMFGTTIADYIYSLEQAHTGDGVAFFKALFPEDYYSYDSGTLKSVQTSAHKTYDADGNVIGNYPLDNSITLMGVPKLADGKLYYDGDEYPPNGAVNRRYNIVNLGTLGWEKNSTYDGLFNSYGLTPQTTGITTVRHICNRFIAVDSTTVITENNSIALSASGTLIFVHCDAYTDAAAFKASLSDVYLVYELNTPTTESATPYTELQEVESGGSEEFVGAEIPVGHESVYPRTLADTMPTADGSYTLSLTVSGGKPSVEWEVSQ